MTISPEALSVHRRSILIDGRDPTFLLYRRTGNEKPDYWDSIRASGFTAITVDVPEVEDGFADAAVNYVAWQRRVDAVPWATVIRSAADIRAAKADDRVGFILSSQTPTIFENRIELVRANYDLGLRVVQLSYQKRNLIADGCGEPQDGGVSAYGRLVIDELNRLGVAIDISHASDRTMRDAIALSAAPPFFSHSNARAVVPHPRNVPDEVLRDLAAVGGICCISAYADFLKQGGSVTGTTLSDYVDMVRYVADLIGVENIGIGFDVGEARTAAEVAHIGGADPTKRYVMQLRSRRDLPLLTEILLERGFSEDEVAGIMGGNLLRYYETVWGS